MVLFNSKNAIALIKEQGMKIIHLMPWRPSQGYRWWLMWLLLIPAAVAANTTPPRIRTVPPIMVMVSLGMPTAALHALQVQAHRYQVPLVIRGLLPQGFRYTLQQLYRTLPTQGAKQRLGGALIEPTWFQRFGITQVPAFVQVPIGACEAAQVCAASRFDVVYGNVSLTDALHYLAAHGQHGQVAQAILEGAP